MATPADALQFLNSTPKDATKFKLELFKLAKRFQDEKFLEEFVAQGGSDVLLRVIQKEKGNAASYAMKALLQLFETEHSLDSVSQNQALFQRLYTLIYSVDGTVGRNALALLSVFCDFAEDGFHLIDTAAHHALTTLSLPDTISPYKQLVDLLADKDMKTQKEAATLIHTLLKKSVIVGRTSQFIEHLSTLRLRETLQEVETKTPSIDMKRIIEEIRTACSFTSSTSKHGVAQEVDQVSAVLSQQQFRVEALANTMGQQFGGESLSGRVRAVTGVATIAGETKSDGQLVDFLQNHLLKMEKAMNELKLENMEVETKRRKEIQEAEKKQAQMHEQMLEQQKRFEAAVSRLEKGGDQKKIFAGSGDTSALQEQINQLKQNQQLLMKDYEAQQMIAAQRQYLQQHDVLWMFYQCVQMKLNEILLAYKVLASGLVKGETKVTTNKFSQVVSLAGDMIPLPGASLATSIIAGAMNYWSQQKYRKKISMGNEFAVTVSAMEKMSEEAARILAFRYEAQLRLLSPKGVRLLSECGVRRMLEAMRSGLVIYNQLSHDHMAHSETIVERLVDATIFVDVKCGALKMKNKKVETKSKELNWTEAGVFTKTGVRTLDDKFFSSKTLRPEKYGYRLGEEKSISKLGLEEAPQVKSSVPSLTTVIPQQRKVAEEKAAKMGTITRPVLQDRAQSAPAVTKKESFPEKTVESHKPRRGSAPSSDSIATIASAAVAASLAPGRKSMAPSLPPRPSKTQPVVNNKPSTPVRPSALLKFVPQTSHKRGSSVPPPAKRRGSNDATVTVAVTTNTTTGRRPSNPSLVTSTGRRGSNPSLLSTGRRGSNPSLSTTVTASSSMKSTRPAVSTISTRPPLVRQRSAPVTGSQQVPSTSEGDKVLVERSIIDHYETRLMVLESKLEELTTIKKQMAEMQMMMKTLLSLQGLNPDTPLLTCPPSTLTSTTSSTSQTFPPTMFKSPMGKGMIPRQQQQQILSIQS